MQPALRDVVQYFTVPASAATAGDRFAAIRSFPSCAPPDRGAPKSLMYCTWPTSGKTMWSGTFGAAARAVPATRPMIAARKRTPRAVVRWRLIRGRALRFASEGSEGTRAVGSVELRPHEDRRLRQAGPRGKPSHRPRFQAARPLGGRGAQPF